MPYRSSLCLMASMVRERSISSAELVDAHLKQIEAQNPRLNAFVSVLADEARATALLADAPHEPRGLLHGVPVTVKDSFDIAGLPTLCGSRFRAGHRAARDATAVGRLRAAGAVVLGKTNCPEFLSSYETDNYLTGRTNNPWNVDRTAGGSSGGEAAAIAAFCSPGGIGSDGGGSIRVPAHFCGITGLKPTPGRVPATGHFPLINHPGGLLGVAGPMARTVQDVRLLFDVLAGYDNQDPFSAPVPLTIPDLKGIRAGLMEQFYDVPVQPEIADTVAKAARTLQQAGIAVEVFRPRGLERAPNLWWFFFGRLAAPFTKNLIEGREQDAHWTCTEFLYGAFKEEPPTVEQIMVNLAARDALRASLLRQMEAAQIDVLLLPPCGVTAFPHRSRNWDAGAKRIGLFQAMMPATFLNLLGMPAVVLPFGMSDGLPVGVQIAGKPYDEELILEVAARLEEERGTFPSPAE